MPRIHYPDGHAALRVVLDDDDVDTTPDDIHINKFAKV